MYTCLVYSFQKLGVICSAIIKSLSERIHHSLGKIWREKIFIGRHVRQKLNTQKFFTTKK